MNKLNDPINWQDFVIMTKSKYCYEKMQSMFKGKTNSTLLQLFRYTFVGGFAFIVDFGTLYVLTEYFNIYYLVSAGIAFISGLIINYFLSVKWVFNNRAVKIGC